MKKLAVAITVLILMISGDLSGQQTWRETVASAVPANRYVTSLDSLDLSVSPVYAMSDFCAYALPDSFALVTGRTGLGAEISFGHQDWTSRQRQAFIQPPPGPDTLAVRLVGAKCGRNPHGMIVAMLLDAGDFHLFYSPCTAPTCLADPYPDLRVIEDGKLVELLYDNVIERTGSERANLAVRNSLAEAERAARGEVARAAAEVQRQRAERVRSRGWSDQIVEAVLARQILIGMNADMVREAWGAPQNVNRTTTAYGVSEQWVYSLRTYVYLHNGIVTTIQN